MITVQCEFQHRTRRSLATGPLLNTIQLATFQQPARLRLVIEIEIAQMRNIQMAPDFEASFSQPQNGQELVTFARNGVDEADVI